MCSFVINIVLYWFLLTRNRMVQYAPMSMHLSWCSVMEAQPARRTCTGATPSIMQLRCAAPASVARATCATSASACYSYYCRTAPTSMLPTNTDVSRFCGRPVRVSVINAVTAQCTNIANFKILQKTKNVFI